MLPTLPGVALAITLAIPHPIPLVEGTASYYDYHTHQAAAGPALRKFLGKNWRGTVVRVCTKTQCIQVRLTDWMRADKLIDLHKNDFARLAPTWRGLVHVTVSKLQ